MKALIIDALASGKGERKATKDVIGAGPRVVAGVLESRNVKVRIVEAETVLKDGFPAGFDILFVSGMTNDIPAIRKLVSRWGDAPSLVGGPITSDPEQALRRTGCNIAIVGEGEETLSEMLDAGLRRGELPIVADLKRIPGTAFEASGDINVNRLRKAMPRILFDEFKASTNAIQGYELYHSARVYVEVVRGCSNYNRASLGVNCESCGICKKGRLEERYDCPQGIPPGCGYCSVPSLFGPPKSHSTKHVSDEVKALLNEGVTRVVLSAPCFLDYGRDLLVEPAPLTDPRSPEPNYSEIEKLLASLAELPRMEEETASFMIENLKASLVTEKAAKLLGRYLSGTPVSIGFETGSKTHSDALGRPSTPEETITAVRRLNKRG